MTPEHSSTPPLRPLPLLPSNAKEKTKRKANPRSPSVHVDSADSVRRAPEHSHFEPRIPGHERSAFSSNDLIPIAISRFIERGHSALETAGRYEEGYRETEEEKIKRETAEIESLKIKDENKTANIEKIGALDEIEYKGGSDDHNYAEQPGLTSGEKASEEEEARKYQGKGKGKQIDDISSDEKKDRKMLQKPHPEPFPEAITNFERYCLSDPKKDDESVKRGREALDAYRLLLSTSEIRVMKLHGQNLAHINIIKRGVERQQELSRIIEEKNKKITVLEEGQNPGGRSIRELKTEVELLKKEVISKDEIISDLRRQLKEAITLRDGNTNAECEKGLEVTKKEVADIEALGKPALEIETQSTIKEYRTQKHETSIQQEESQLSGENNEQVEGPSGLSGPVKFALTRVELALVGMVQSRARMGIQENDTATAIEAAQNALSLAQKLNDNDFLGRAYYWMTVALYYAGDDAAQIYMDEAKVLRESIKDDLLRNAVAAWIENDRISKAVNRNALGYRQGLTVNPTWRARHKMSDESRVGQDERGDSSTGHEKRRASKNSSTNSSMISPKNQSQNWRIQHVAGETAESGSPVKPTSGDIIKE